MTQTVKHGGPSLPQRRELVTEVPGPKSRQIMARKEAAVASGVGVGTPVAIVAAGGGVLVDADGNSFIDLGSGIAVTNVGNSAPAVVDAVIEQTKSFTHTCFTVTPYEGYIALAEKLNELTPGTHEKRSALFNSGAEAIENAVKIARRYTGRGAIVVFDHAYHGRTNLTMGMTAKNMPYKDGFGPFAPDIYRVSASYPFRDGRTGAQAAEVAISEIEKQVGAANLAAVFIEPIMGEGGFIVPAAGFLPALQKWCNDNEVVFVLDEVQTGFARTGHMFAAEHEGVVPDMITTAKGIAGGLPLSAVTGRVEIMNASHAGGLGGTYAGSPISCAAALAAIDSYESENLVVRARHMGELIEAKLRELAARDARVADVRGRGALQAIELAEPGTGRPLSELTATVVREAAQKGVIALSCGTYGNVIRLLPPLSITDELLGEALDVLALILEENPA